MLSYSRKVLVEKSTYGAKKEQAPKSRLHSPQNGSKRNWQRTLTALLIWKVFHIGRRHVTDPSGDPLVIDWRAEVSGRFYRASHTDPMGVLRRRRFGLDHGDITALEDEHLTDRAEPQGRSAILAAEIERPRVVEASRLLGPRPEHDPAVASADPAARRAGAAVGPDRGGVSG